MSSSPLQFEHHRSTYIRYIITRPYGVTRDRYWKVGIKLPDFNHACRDLQTKGVAVPALYHFKDIYFMSHLINLEGFQIELTQNTFLDKGKSVTERMDNTLGGRCQFKQIALGTTYIVAEISYFVYDSGMKILSSLPLYAYGFELLFFLGCTEKKPPNSDLIVLENCPWL